MNISGFPALPASSGIRREFLVASPRRGTGRGVALWFFSLLFLFFLRKRPVATLVTPFGSKSSPSGTMAIYLHFSGFCRAPLGSTGLYRVFYRASLAFNRFYPVWLALAGFYWVLQCGTGFHSISLGFTEFYRVFLDFQSAANGQHWSRTSVPELLVWNNGCWQRNRT